MGQEFLEDKQWADDAGNHPNLLLHWSGLQAGERSMVDHLRFVGDLTRLRRSTPALCGEGLHVITVDNLNRVLAFQRWVEGEGHDVVVLVSLNDNTLYDYEIGMPAAGNWRERFNSDVYDHFPNQWATGNAGSVSAYGAGMHGLPARARLTIPANSLLVLGG
jgi:1,4-alpha-glucan branching enzyme